MPEKMKKVPLSVRISPEGRKIADELHKDLGISYPTLVDIGLRVFNKLIREGMTSEEIRDYALGQLDVEGAAKLWQRREEGE